MKRLSSAFSVFLLVAAFVVWWMPADSGTIDFGAKRTTVESGVSSVAGGGGAGVEDCIYCPDVTPGYNCGPCEVDDYTRILLHFDQGSGADWPEDCSGSTYSPHSPAVNVTYPGGVGNSPNINSDSAYFGASGVSVDGTGFYVFSSDEEFQPKLQDWTIDLWSKVPSTVANNAYVLAGSAEVGPDLLVAHVNGYLGVYNVVNGWAQSITTDIRDDTWHHLAYVRSGTTIIMFIDGVKDYVGVGYATDTFWDPGAVYGFCWNAGNAGWIGDIDEFRISVGIARWTENFSVPTAAY